MRWQRRMSTKIARNCQGYLWLRSSTVRLDYCRLASPEIRSDMPGPHLEEQQGYIQNFLGSFAMQKSLTTDENVLCLLLCGLCAFRKKLLHAHVAYLILYKYYIYIYICYPPKTYLLVGWGLPDIVSSRWLQVSLVKQTMLFRRKVECMVCSASRGKLKGCEVMQSSQRHCFLHADKWWLNDHRQRSPVATHKSWFFSQYSYWADLTLHFNMWEPTFEFWLSFRKLQHLSMICVPDFTAMSFGTWAASASQAWCTEE